MAKITEARVLCHDVRVFLEQMQKKFDEMDLPAQSAPLAPALQSDLKTVVPRATASSAVAQILAKIDSIFTSPPASPAAESMAVIYGQAAASPASTPTTSSAPTATTTAAATVIAPAAAVVAPSSLIDSTQAPSLAESPPAAPPATSSPTVAEILATLDSIFASPAATATAAATPAAPVSTAPSAQVSSLLHAAADHKPAKLIFDVGGGNNNPLLFELPCFPLATAMNLHIWGP